MQIASLEAEELAGQTMNGCHRWCLFRRARVVWREREGETGSMSVWYPTQRVG